jgi:hypothetical protein
MSTIHFSGQFLFQIPDYNNDPYRQKFEYDPDLSKEQIFRLCGCDPAHYFELSFQQVMVNRITYKDGTLADNKDPLLDKNIQLTAFMPSISPSLSCYILYACTIRIGDDILTGKLGRSSSSEFRLNIRPLDETTEPLEASGAHFETQLEILDKNMSINSRYFDEISHLANLEIYFHLNNYCFYDSIIESGGNIEKALKGDVYGYIRPILAHQNIDSNKEIAESFLFKIIKGDDSVTQPRINFNNEIDGTYDVIKSDNLLCLRYLDFIPLVDKEHNILDVDKYLVSFENETTKKKTLVGEFKGDYKQMKSDGGIAIFKVPVEVEDNDNTKLIVEVVKQNKIFPLMMEAEYDFILEGDRTVILYSGEETEIIARVFKNNKILKKHTVFFETPVGSPEYVPVSFDPHRNGETTTDENGILKCKIEAMPISSYTDDEWSYKEDFRFWGIPDGFSLDIDHANYLYLRIENPSRITTARINNVEVHVEEIQIAARVIHVIEQQKIRQISFKKHILPLFSFYTRYYPWLHVYEDNGTYKRFFNIEDYEQFSNNVNNILSRLKKDDDDTAKMPRSRDFPRGAVELIERWLKAGMPK